MARASEDAGYSKSCILHGSTLAQGAQVLPPLPSLRPHAPHAVPLGSTPVANLRTSADDRDLGPHRIAQRVYKSIVSTVRVVTHDPATALASTATAVCEHQGETPPYSIPSLVAQSSLDQLCGRSTVNCVGATHLHRITSLCAHVAVVTVPIR